MRPGIIAGRLALAGLLGWMAGIHLDLWNHGYSHIHVIGNLFLATFVVGVLGALAVLGSPRRFVALPAFGGTLFATGTIVGFVLSVNVGLFGFHDSTTAPFAGLALAVEAAAVGVGLGLTAAGVVAYRREGGGRPRSP